jgi:hypothetical protein
MPENTVKTLFQRAKPQLRDSIRKNLDPGYRPRDRSETNPGP